MHGGRDPHQVAAAGHVVEVADKSVVAVVHLPVEQGVHAVPACADLERVKVADVDRVFLEQC